MSPALSKDSIGGFSGLSRIDWESVMHKKEGAG